MTKPANQSSEELERLLIKYEEEIQELCRLYNMSLKRDKRQKERIKAAAKELSDLHVETEDQSVHTIIGSGIEVMRRTIELLENDSDPDQPCSSEDPPRALSDTEKKTLWPGVVRHHQQIMGIIRRLKRNFLRGRSPARRELKPMVDNFIQVYTKIGLFGTVLSSDEDYGELQRLKISQKLWDGDFVGSAGVMIKYPARPSTFNTAAKDCCYWEPTKPSEDTTEADVKYSVSSGAGMFECSETGLRWHSYAPVTLEYCFVHWESFRTELEKLNCVPCGPLMDISVTSGTLEDVLLPHFICVDSVPSDAIKALHVDDSGVSLERCELKQTHAKILHPTFSLWGIVTEIHQYFTMRCFCETLIYRSQTPALNLHVYLIVKDPHLKKVVEKDEKDNKFILKPRPNEAQKMNESYTLNTSCVSRIRPESLKLTPRNPNFFDVHIADAREDLELHIMTQNNEKIWDVYLQSDDFNINGSVTDGGRATRSKSDADVSEILLQTLKSLKSDELKEFKWHLMNGVGNFRKLTECDLEDADRCDVVTRMIKKYEEDGAGELTVMILGKIQMNNTAKELQETLEKMKKCQCTSALCD